MKKFEDFIKKIEESNETFKNLSNAEKRVEIAKDTLLRIEVGNLIAEGSLFIRASNFKEGSLKEQINSSSFNCEVCAKGGLFLSYIGRVNNFTEEGLSGHSRLRSNEMQKLLEIFDPLQLDGIEAAFEEFCFTWTTNEDPEFIEDCFDYFEGSDYNQDEKLISICKNIIKHNGDFNPKVFVPWNENID